MRRTRHTALLVCGISAIGALCCTQARSHPEQLGRATLTGRVRLAADAELPAFAPLDLRRAPLIPEAAEGDTPPGCAEANARARQPVRVTRERLLSNVVVVASDFTGVRLGAPAKPRMHEVAIRGCTLTPAVLAARGGDWLELHNADAVPYSPQIGAAVRENPLAPGQRVRVPLEGGRVTSVVCPPSRPCGRTDVVVLHHPLFAVSGAAGEFRIDGFPHGEMVRVTAWHPLFEPSETFVWLEQGERASIELELVPKPSFVPGTAGASDSTRRRAGP